MAGCGEGRNVKVHGQGGGDRLDEGAGRGMGVDCPSGSGGIVFCGELVDCGGEVNKKIILEVHGRTSKVSVVCLGEVGNEVDEREEVWP